MLHCLREMDTSDSTYYSNLLTSCSILPDQSINLQIKSRPCLKGKTHFLNEKNQKLSQFLKARKWSPYTRCLLACRSQFCSYTIACNYRLSQKILDSRPEYKFIVKRFSKIEKV